MTHFGIICPPGDGHLNPMIVLGYELLTRGHCVTVFSAVDAQTKTIAAGLGFVAIGEYAYPEGSAARVSERLGELHGMAALLYTLNQSKRTAEVILQDAPNAISNAGVEALLIDQTILEGSTVAEVLELPFVTVCGALMLDSEPNVPPPITPWEYDPSWWGYIRNQIGYSLLGLAGLPLRKVIEDYRRQWNLSLVSRPSFDDINSRLAVISQQPKEFEFPRTNLPPHFQFTGPLVNSAIRAPVAFPKEKLTGQPLIYASLGTVQNRLRWIFREIALACVGLDVQLVISLGGSLSLEDLGKLAGSPIVVNYAPQLELLQLAALCITHAGLNTVLESLSNGVPMVAIPLANDQPAVAARIAWTRTGEVISLNQLSVSRLKSVIERLLSDDSYKKNARKLQAAIKRAGGVTKAADIVEQAISTRQPVYRII